MGFDDPFDVFSDDGDDTAVPIAPVIPSKRRREVNGKSNGNTTTTPVDAHADKRQKASSGAPRIPVPTKGPILRDLDPTYRPVVTDAVEQDVEQEYRAADQLVEPNGAAQGGSAAGAAQTQQAPAAGPSTEVSTVKLKHQVRHQVALPPDYPYIAISEHVPPAEPARTYKFTLDPFQQTAIYSIQRNESVLVAAHTSAGKTVVAEYAIAQSLRDKQRVVYTSPIKALSNQKYRELLAEFGDVGLMTGDVTINPGAGCLVMTTEILRSMLYRGSEIIREVAWIIFDEIHYMRDKARGVVWEETIILLPDKVHFVFLSATIPNAMQFAEWICKIHSQPCHVVYTDYRPTPLQHYLFPAGGSGIHLVVDEKSQFREDNFQRAIAALGDKDDDGAGGGKKGGPKGKGRKDRSTKGQTDVHKLIKMTYLKNMMPVIVFSFAKRDCEANAVQISKLDFNDDSEKQMVHNVFTNAIHSLNEDDRNLPQIQNLLPLLKRGIGVHHAGLLPILKEVIEILFQEGLLKVLFATETFSIGLNMPAKTVVFTAVRKWDGKEQRWLGGGEYIQMSGRAGRRGLDDRGLVILMIDEKMEPAVAKGMLKGVADPLNSAFHLTYTMILNLMRIEGINAEFILKRSFYQFQSAAKVPQLTEEMRIYEQRRDNLEIPREPQIAEYYEIRFQLDQYRNDMKAVINHPQYIKPFLQSGRLVRVRMDAPADSGEKQYDFGYGVVLMFSQTVTKNRGKDISAGADEPTLLVDVLIHCAPGTEASGTKTPKPAPPGVQGDLIALSCALNVLDDWSSVRLKVPKDMRSAENRMQLWKSLKEVHRRFPDGPPMLDPIEDMGIRDDGFVKLIKRTAILETKLRENPLHTDPDLPSLYEQYELKLSLQTKIKTIKKQIQTTESVLQLDELKNRMRVLRRLGYTTPTGVIEMKGRVACEISAGDELLLTEMIFSGVFNDLTVEQCVSLLSCFTFQEKADDNTKLRDELTGPLRDMQASARRIAKVSIESKLALDEEEYVQSFRHELMDVTYAWAKGAKFSEIVKMTDVFEGSIIRSMRRLEELLRQMCSASRILGNSELENKFAEGITKIKRDIVFAASLYL
ncbi:ATP-dependent RNA helicase mtr4 [Rhizophlyctis rosea]|nr:ATP-dependent RNA helicase mtr4 [Rhizophlyctis rosea]